MPGIEPWSTAYKADALPAVLLLCFQKNHRDFFDRNFKIKSAS